MLSHKKTENFVDKEEGHRKVFGPNIKKKLLFLLSGNSNSVLLMRLICIPKFEILAHHWIGEYPICILSFCYYNFCSNVQWGISNTHRVASLGVWGIVQLHVAVNKKKVTKYLTTRQFSYASQVHEIEHKHWKLFSKDFPMNMLVAFKLHLKVM